MAAARGRSGAGARGAGAARASSTPTSWSRPFIGIAINARAKRPKGANRTPFGLLRDEPILDSRKATQLQTNISPRTGRREHRYLWSINLANALTRAAR